MSALFSYFFLLSGIHSHKIFTYRLVFEHVHKRDDDALIEARQEMKTFLLNRKSATTDDRQQLLFMVKINM